MQYEIWKDVVPYKGYKNESLVLTNVDRKYHWYYLNREDNFEKLIDFIHKNKDSINLKYHFSQHIDYCIRLNNQNLKIENVDILLFQEFLKLNISFDENYYINRVNFFHDSGHGVNNERMGLNILYYNKLYYMIIHCILIR